LIGFEKEQYATVEQGLYFWGVWWARGKTYLMDTFLRLFANGKEICVCIFIGFYANGSIKKCEKLHDVKTTTLEIVGKGGFL